MTAGDDGGGRVQYAVHGLLSAWREHDQRCTEVLDGTRREAENLARMLDGIDGLAGVDGLDSLGEQVAGIMKTGTAQAEHELRRAGESYATETRALLALLTGDPGLTTAAFTLPDPGSGIAGIVATFTTDTSRRYVGHLLGDHDASSTQPADAAGTAATTGTAASPAHVDTFTAMFPDHLRPTITAMITHPRSHAIQAHGPDVTDDALQARLTWRKDPVGRDNHAHRWTLHDDGTVTTNHGVGATAGRFNSIEALANPLQAVVHACGNTTDGLDTYLNANSKGKIARIYVPATLAGLEPGDTAAFRGAGAKTAKMADDWQKGRTYAMHNGADPMPIVPTNPTVDGADPGAAMIFRKAGDRWIMTTCYPVAQQPQDFTRLRGSTS